MGVLSGSFRECHRNHVFYLHWSLDTLNPKPPPVLRSVLSANEGGSRTAEGS